MNIYDSKTSSFSFDIWLPLLSNKRWLCLLLIDPKIRILNKIFLLLSIVVLRHRPKIKILVLSSILRGINFFLATVVSLSIPISRCPCSNQSLVFNPHHLCLKFLIFPDKFFLPLCMIIYFFVLFPDHFSHFLYFLLQFTVFTINSNHNFLICFVSSKVLSVISVSKFYLFII